MMLLWESSTRNDNLNMSSLSLVFPFNLVWKGEMERAREGEREIKCKKLVVKSLGISFGMNHGSICILQIWAKRSNTNLEYHNEAWEYKPINISLAKIIKWLTNL